MQASLLSLAAPALDRAVDSQTAGAVVFDADRGEDAVRRGEVEPLVVAPANRAAVGADGATVVVSAGHEGVAAGGRLPGGVAASRAPAGHALIRPQAARERRSRAYGREFPGRRRREVLAAVVHSPAFDSSVLPDAAAVGEAGADRDEGPVRGLNNRLGDWVRSPAGRCSVGAQTAGVFFHDAHRGELPTGRSADLGHVTPAFDTAVASPRGAGEESEPYGCEGPFRRGLRPGPAPGDALGMDRTFSRSIQPMWNRLCALVPTIVPGVDMISIPVVRG